MSLWEADIVRLPAQETMDVLCRGLADAVRMVPGVPSRVRVRFGSASIDSQWRADPTAPGPAVLASAAQPPAADAHQHTLCAPLVGTFYRALEPGAKPFVQAGALVAARPPA